MAYIKTISPVEAGGELKNIYEDFNFVNRIVLGLGVTSAEEEIKGYKY